MTDYADTADPSPITPGRAATICQIEKKHTQLLDLVDRLVCGKNTDGFINWGNIKDHGMDIFLSTVQKVLEKADQYNPLQPFEAWFSYWANFEIAHAQQKANGRSRTNKVYSLKEEESFDNFPDQKSLKVLTCQAHPPCVETCNCTIKIFLTFPVLFCQKLSFIVQSTQNFHYLNLKKER